MANEPASTVRARRLRERRSRGVVMVAPVEVGEGGVGLLVGSGLLKQHQAGDRHAVGEACLAALWSCPCLVERRRLSFGHNGLECDRRLIAERGVASGWIVEAVDVTANGVFGVLSGLESGPPDEF